MRITLVISSLSCGGSERAMVLLADRLAERGHELSLVTIASPEADFYTPDPRIRRVALGLAGDPRHVLHALTNNLKRWAALRRAIRASRPEVVLSFLAETNILTLASCAGLGLAVIVSERVDPRCSPIGRIRERLRRWLYPAAAAVVVQTTRVRDWMERALVLRSLRVIPNAVEPASGDPDARAQPSQRSRLVVGMGRLTRQKGFDLLLRAFATCSARHPDWRLLILGEGQERGSLERLAERLGISPRVDLPGTAPCPGAILRRADLFVLASRFEGFPNALLEGMACGLAVIAADCPSGPAEIVRSGRDGLLVPAEDAEALAAAMDRLMSDENERRRLGERARDVLERFSVEKIAGMWEDLIRECCTAHR